MGIVWLSLLAPYNYLYGFSNSINVYYIFLFAMAISLATKPHEFHIQPINTMILIVIFVIHGAISTFLTVSTKSIPWDILDRMVKICIVSIIIISITTNRIRMQAMTIIFVLGLGFHSIIDGLKTLVTGGQHVVKGVPQLGDNNSFGLAMLMVTPMAYYVFNNIEVKWIRYGFLVVTLTSILAAIGTNSRGALIAMVALACIFIYRSKSKITNTLLVTVVAVFVLAFAPDRWVNRMDTIHSAGADSSFMGRVTAWQLSFVMAADHPIFGLGYHAMQDTQVWVSYIPNFRSFYPHSARVPDSAEGHAAHSIIFEALADTGFAGLGIFTMIIVSAFKNISKIKQLTLSVPEMVWALDLATAMELALVSYVVAGLALSVCYYECFYVLISLIAALRLQVEKHALAPKFPAQRDGPVTRLYRDGTPDA